VDLLNEDKAGVRHCWEKTELLRAWERSAQIEASTKVCELFPKLSEEGIAIDITSSEDEEAGELGAPFTEPEHEEEWVAWVNWSAVDAQTGGAGGSSL
jgi:hypothetical protein